MCNADIGVWISGGLRGNTHMTSARGGGRGVPQKQTKADEGGRWGQADLDVQM